MSCIQMTAYQPSCVLTNIYQLNSVSSIICVAPVQTFSLPRTSLKLRTPSIYLGSKLPKLSPKLIGATSKYQQLTTVCLFGGKGDSDNGNEASPWKALENVMGNLKKDQSIEDVLRQQMKKQEYFDDGGSGGNPPGGGGGDSSGESDDEGLPGILDELMQVILATVGFVFLYMYIIEGEEITRLAKDFIKFLFGGQKSIRLRRTMDQWRSFFQRLREKKEVDPYWLEREILNTPTWWDSPTKYKHILRRQVASRSY